MRTVVELSTRAQRGARTARREPGATESPGRAAGGVASSTPRAARIYELVAPTDDPVFGHGFDLLPEPDDGDVFFDFEGHPSGRAQHDSSSSRASLLRDGRGEWLYDARWAHDLDEQAIDDRGVGRVLRRATSGASRHARVPLQPHRAVVAGATDQGNARRESLFTTLVETGLFVDLYVVAKNAFQVGTESYGLKSLEHLTGFERHGGIEQGRRRRRGVRPLHDDEGSDVARGDRALQRGRRRGDDGAS